MKKTLLVLLLAASAGQLKAQQMVPANPSDSLLNKLLVKPAPFPSIRPSVNSNLNKLLVNTASNNIDHMPVVVLNGYSKMPVAKVGGYYTMPVKKIGSEEVPGNLNSLPLLPTLKTP